MQAYSLCHRFFHFSRSSWISLWGNREPKPSELRTLFREELFARRCLRGPFPFSLEEAQAVHKEQVAKDEAQGVRAIPEGSPDYPESLVRHLPPERRPALLYLRGQALPPEESMVAVVGTRHPSSEGKENASCFAAYFTVVGLKIISGLARGIDTLAHQENLKMGTVAVLGSSVTEIYPAENQGLAEQILKHGGTLASPFPTGQAPLPGNFPQRNELIAALSAGVLVVEGAEKSGAAITGKQALSMGKSVLALATDFRSEFGRGALRLQQAGANFVANEEEALQALFLRFGGHAAGPLLPGTLNRRTFTAEEFCTAANGSVPEGLATLQEGLLTGQILRIGPNRYRLRDREG